MKKVMMTVFKIVLILIAVVVVGVVALILFALHKESNYYKYTEAVGEIEQKYTAFGDKEVSCQEYDANDDVIGKYAVWYPSELESSNTQYPVVIFANGTGSTLSTYKPFLTHLSSWGFISVGNDDENTRTGASLEETIKFLIAENEKKDSIFYHKIDLDNIGIAGHSQGGPAVFNMVTNQEHGSMVKALYAASATSSYTQLFNLLCEKADDVYGGRLPIHVRCLIDEAANIGQIPRLEKLVATIRSREISACLVLQAQSQLKALYRDNADTIIGNMDARLFLGGSEPTTLKELSAALGKETIDTYNTGESRGRETSHSLNYQKLGKELASMDELAVLDGGKCILQLRGVRPFLSDKYDITKHPNYKYLSDSDKRNAFDIERFLSVRLKPKAEEVYDVYEVDLTDEEAATA